jgi:hypothetical protein
MWGRLAVRILSNTEDLRIRTGPRFGEAWRYVISLRIRPFSRVTRLDRIDGCCWVPVYSKILLLEAVCLVRAMDEDCAPTRETRELQRIRMEWGER